MRYLLLPYAILCYLVFFASLVYFLGFLAGFDLLPSHVDKGLVGTQPWPAALAIDFFLVALFGIQHSVMARPGFKRVWTKIVPPPAERATYVLLASIALFILALFWQPLPGTIWHVEAPFWRGMIWGLFFTGFLVTFAATHMLSHWELFGLAQPYRHLRGQEEPEPLFRTPLFYRLVRHPIYTGFLISLWASPDMTVSHAVFAAAMTVYILIGVRYEENDLHDVFGDSYRDYSEKTPALVPGMGRRR